MSSDDDVDYSKIQSALESIGLSAVLIFGATLLSQGLGFLTRLIMARYLPVDGYGNVAIGLSVLNLFGLVALAGMPAALSRYIPRQETTDERQSILVSALQLVGILSLTVAICIFLAAELLATVVFGDQNLVWIIRIFAGILPFYAMFKLSLGGFRGYETTYPRIITQNVLRPGLQLAGIILFVLVGYGTAGLAFAYAMAFTIVAAIGLLILYRVSELSVLDVVKQYSVEQYQELLRFSIPLAASGAITTIAKHSDLIILGILKSSTEVGIYEVSFRMSLFVYLLFIPAVGYLFQPIMSRLDSDSERQKMDQLYTVATRWIVIGSFPTIVLFFLFPEQTLRFVFGERYVGGVTAFRILVVGFTIALLPGLTTNFLTSIGETKLIFYISAATLAINILLNIVLIPFYGIIGAAVATASARAFNNLTSMYFIYHKYTIHPFKREFVMPTVFITTILCLVVVVPLPVYSLTFLQGFAVAIVFSFGYLTLYFVTQSIYAVELTLIDALLQKLGISIQVSDQLSRFVR